MLFLFCRSCYHVKTNLVPHTSYHTGWINNKLLSRYRNIEVAVSYILSGRRCSLIRDCISWKTGTDSLRFLRTLVRIQVTVFLWGRQKWSFYFWLRGFQKAWKYYSYSEFSYAINDISLLRIIHLFVIRNTLCWIYTH